MTDPTDTPDLPERTHVMDTAALLAEEVRIVTSPEFVAAVDRMGKAANRLCVAVSEEIAKHMSTDTPDLQRILEEMAPTTPLRAEVERAIVQYGAAWQEVTTAEERNALMRETRRVLAHADERKQALWALLDRVPWSAVPDRSLTIQEPSPELRELVEIAQQLNGSSEMDALLDRARHLLEHGRY